MLHRVFSAICTLLLAGGLAVSAQAQQGYPSKPVRVVVPAAGGSGPDVIARLFADQLKDRLGGRVFVEAIPGVAGNTGVESMANAPADGHTLLFGFNQLISINPQLYKHLPFDPKELVSISLVASAPYILVANKDLPANTMAELIALAKAQPGKLAFASTGLGTASYLGMERLMRATGTKMLHVPYRASSNAVADLLGNHVQLRLEILGTGVPMVKEGRVKAIAVTGLQRLKVLPQVPTFAETLPGVSFVGWNAFWVRKGTPPDVIARLNKEIREIGAQPDIQQRLENFGMTPQTSTPGEMQALMDKDVEQWGAEIRALGVQPE